VGADHRRDAAVEPARERHLLARRLGVKVDQDHLRALASLVDQLVDDLERADRRVDEEPAEQIDHRHRSSVGGRSDGQPPPW
jgi:hypothetical protein